MSAAKDVDIVLAAVRAHTRVLKLPTVGRECDGLARQALADGNAPVPVELRVVEAARLNSYATFFSDATVEASDRRAVTSEGMCT